jgi:hypothetical protein
MIQTTSTVRVAELAIYGSLVGDVSRTSRGAGPGGDVAVMAQANNVASVRGAKLKKAASLNSLAEEIIEALLEMGGSAHRDAVIDRVAMRLGAVPAPDSLKGEILEAFERHRSRAKLKNDRVLLHLPFGEGSRRWSLTPDGRQLVHNRHPFERSEFL